MTRPASPLPRTRLRSTSRSSAALRAVGVERVFSDAAFGSASVFFASGVADAGITAFSNARGAPPPGAAPRLASLARRRRRAALAAAASSTTPSTSPTFTSSPVFRPILSTPPCGAATSRSTLSVSSSTSGSPTDTTSPSLRSHLATRASTIDSPTSGTTMFDGMQSPRSLVSGQVYECSGLRSRVVRSRSLVSSGLGLSRW